MTESLDLKGKSLFILNLQDFSIFFIFSRIWHRLSIVGKAIRLAAGRPPMSTGQNKNMKKARRRLGRRLR